MNPYTRKLMGRVFYHYADTTKDDGRRKELSEIVQMQLEGNNSELGITLFNCKAAVLELLNLDIPLRALIKILIEGCKWISTEDFIPFQKFSDLIALLLSHPEASSFDLENPSELYAEIDKPEKGWIRKDEFKDFLWLTSPKLCENYCDDWFSVIDTNSTGRLSKPNVIPLLERLKDEKTF